MLATYRVKMQYVLQALLLEFLMVVYAKCTPFIQVVVFNGLFKTFDVLYLCY